jgi:hypothetical protein
MNADVADIAHARGALVGYVHPFDEFPQPLARPKQALTNELPVDVALGKVDYMEILGFSDHRSTAAVWYKLLNLGFRIPAAGGTDAMADYSSLRGPVGMNRMYVRESAEGTDPQKWMSGLKAGHSFATNGPLLGFNLGGAAIGDELHFGTAQPRLKYSVRMRSVVAVDRLDLICNGRVARSLITRKPLAEADFAGNIPITDSGWCVLRASTDTAREPIMDNYVYATTSPIYVTIGSRPPRSSQDAAYFIAWIDRLTEGVVNYPDWNAVSEKDVVLRRLAEAKAIFEGRK